ncbi:hypothetical protein E2R68_06765 [Psychromonas sp. RZ22]|uniref:hypothetical protein n=1 Tax=Psychromonas algarum TaxID=2555643 RepID=UPI0010677E45|nr:hypothetical protein [Psychromonas sp. RZ22]TEW54867.1 hypothetical protein E2R68_06765 [Psychromonas sp. RZ22]
MKFIVLFIVFFLSSLNVFADTLKPFKSDGCSLFPNGTFEDHDLWQKCCYEHDLKYWQGGTYQQRVEADKALQLCVSDLDEATIGLLMKVGVRFGGSPFFPTNFRWGYGWSYPRMYGELSQSELQRVKQHLRE